MIRKSDEQTPRIPAPWGGFIEPEDLDPSGWPADVQDLVEVVGMAYTIAICERFSGNQLYIPQLESLLRPARDQAIRLEFNGGNYRGLSRKFHMTESAVRALLAKK